MDFQNIKSIPKLFIERCRLSQQFDKPAFRYKRQGQWIDLSHSELLEKVSCFAVSLLELGIRKGDRIGIVSENRIEWIISSLAINLLGAVDVPLFPILTSKQIETIFRDCSVTGVIVSNNFQLAKILEFKDSLDSLRQLIIMNDEYDSKDVFIHQISNLIKHGCELRNKEERTAIINEQIEKIHNDDILTLIYTSGTTGNPKGVMLSHGNLLANIEGSTNAIGDLSHHQSLLYLPLCHSYERLAGFYTVFFSGAVIALAESIESVPANVNEIKPTLMTTVPKLLETMKKKVLISMDKESAITKTVFNWALKIGTKKVRLKSRGKSNPIINAQYALAHKLVFSKIIEKLGGRMNLFVSGGAPMPVEVGEFFEAVGITVLQGYGLTEASPVISINTISNNELGTIGKPLFNVTVRLGEDGEIIAKGPNIMKGYWGDIDSTKAAIDTEGWLYTGDIGIFTERGNLKITDRKKNIFVSSGGKNIAPQPIENLICQSRYIDNCILIGDNREYIAALISPNFEQLKFLANEFGIEFSTLTELISNQKIIKHIKDDIDYYQNDLSKFERVRKFQLLSEPFSVDGGELSPKMSIKRHIVERKYSDLIETMYK
jgi:long-chain acyl-CoA synthetase